MRIEISDFSKVNEKIKTVWDDHIRDQFENFLVYYANQLAFDKNVGDFYDSRLTDNRLFLALHASSREEAKRHLFGTYNDPEFWLIKNSGSVLHLTLRNEFEE